MPKCKYVQRVMQLASAQLGSVVSWWSKKMPPLPQSECLIEDSLCGWAAAQKVARSVIRMNEQTFGERSARRGIARAWRSEREGGARAESIFKLTTTDGLFSRPHLLQLH